MRLMRISTLLLLIMLAGITNVGAQNGKGDVGLIIGNVLDAESGKAVGDATVKATRITDTTFSRMQVTDKDGNFEFDKLPFDYFRITVSSVGFAALVMDSIYLRAERFDFNLGDMKISRKSENLQEVIVYAEKPLIENKDGKITYNVGESALSGGSSTADLLKSMPLVNNDPNGGILLKGKEPKILIDDKPTDLNAQQLADLLESLPGSSIEKIELMTNPPPQYASEAGGVINIVTKKGKVGVVGKVTLSLGTRGEGTLSSNISYRNKKFTFNSNVGIAASRFSGTNYSRRENFYTDSSNFFNTDSRFLNKNTRPNVRLQGDYEFDKSNSVNVVLQTNYNLFNNFSFTQYTNLNKKKDIYRLSTRENASDGNGYSNQLTFTYTLKGKTFAERLQLIASGVIGKNDNGREFFQEFLRPDFTPSGIDSTQQQGIDNFSNNLSFRANYDRPLKWKGASISTGASFYRGNNHNVINTTFFRKADQQFILNELLSNDFKFHQNILTVRGALTVRLNPKVRITAGAQAEETANGFEFIRGTAPNVKNTYWNLLPNLTARYDFNKTVNASLIYRASIRRPGIGELNPNIDYSDPYNIRFGNPYLSPSLADNFDLNFGVSKGKYYFNASAGYNKVKDIFNTIRTLVDNGKTEITWQNISDRREYEVSFWGGYTFTKKFRVNTSAGFSFNKYNEEDIKLYNYRNGNTFYTSVNYYFTPNTLTTFDGNARFSSFANPQGKARSNLNVNLGVQRKFFKKRLMVSINAIDPFRPQKFATYTYGSKFNLENFNSTRTRNYRIAFAYQLNKPATPKKKVTEKQKQDMIKKLNAQKKG
ncbi:MAG: TonB-dependent receptor [Segetibacter sp.]|nr:TonB-dependent receptor [Segetibacter sp.]